jgi:maleylacetoacetate isomerase
MTTTTTTTQFTYTLYTFYNSSCSARVRIACHLKGISLQYKYIDLLTSGQNAPSYAALNPSEFVPLLIVTEPSTGNEVARISQSTAILEYLDETYPEAACRLLPTGPLARAQVRELWGVIACDTQPVTNQRIVKYLKAHGQGEWEQEWQSHFLLKGLKAYDAIARRSAGKWSVGNEVSLADVALVCAVDRARRYKVDLDGLEVVRRVDGQMRELEAYKRGGWRGQEDAPEGVREKL